jgi:hypothetical protein
MAPCSSMAKAIRKPRSKKIRRDRDPQAVQGRTQSSPWQKNRSLPQESAAETAPRFQSGWRLRPSAVLQIAYRRRHGNYAL